MGLCDSLLPALGFRALAGLAMAGMYMPGLRALTHGVQGATLARIAAWYTSSFTIGASLSFLFGRVGTLLGWRSAFVLAGILGAVGVLIAWAALPAGDTAGREEPQPLLDFRPVLANRNVVALIVGYTVGTALLQIGYQAGGALTVAGLATLLTNAVPIAAGTIVLGEPVPSGVLGGLRVLAYAAVTIGAVLLARPEKPAEQRSRLAAAQPEPEPS